MAHPLVILRGAPAAAHERSLPRVPQLLAPTGIQHGFLAEGMLVQVTERQGSVGITLIVSLVLKHLQSRFGV